MVSAGAPFFDRACCDPAATAADPQGGNATTLLTVQCVTSCWPKRTAAGSATNLETHATRSRSTM
jgi:hypothetical protein